MSKQERIIIHAAIEDVPLAVEWVRRAMTEGATRCGFRIGARKGLVNENRSGSWTVRVWNVTI